MTAQTARLLVDGNGQIIPNQYYDVVTNSFKASEDGTGISVGGTAVSSSNPLPVGGKSVQKSASFTRPADTTAYAANDAVANSTSTPTLLSFANCANANGGQGLHC